MSFFNELKHRGLTHQITAPELEKLLDQKKLTLYCGFDPTSDSLHVGSLLPIITLRRFQEAGHRVIAVAGGATGMIGDPSGKSQERKLLTPDTLKQNVEGIKKTLSQFLNLKDSKKGILLNNADWFKGLSYIDFLRDVGKHFTVNHMMAKESVRARLEDREHGISYTEFSYMLLQAYDFYVLNRDEGCTLQIGGSDQWGNITAGCELIRRMSATQEKEAPHVYGITHPLVMKADGTKFGKSEQGNIWLDPDKTSPYQFYQFFVQTADADVITYLKYFTFLSLEQIAKLEQSVKTEPEKRMAQKTLAQELTRMVHGQAEVDRAEKAAQALFGTEIKDLDSKTLKQIFADAPSTKKSKSDLMGDVLLVDLLVESQLCSSKGAARKDLTAGGIYLNNERITDPAFTVKKEHLIAGSSLVLRKGKKNYHLVVFE